MSPLPDRMADHWWWRPGVRAGRRLLVWHILLDQPEIRDLVRQCRDKLAGLDGLDLVPAEWLHMTTQIVGFTDEIHSEEIEAMVGAATPNAGQRGCALGGEQRQSLLAPSSGPARSQAAHLHAVSR